MASSKSPLKSKPLRNPGESANEALQDLWMGKILSYFLMAGIFVTLAALESLRWYIEAPINPGLFIICAAIAVTVAVWKIRDEIKKSKCLALGRDGEKAVGQFLEGLRESGAKVFHDIPGVGFNIDHVVIHSTGIYVIETKTYSKPVRGDARLIYDGETVTANGFKPERNAIIQVRAASQWLVDLVQESTGMKFPVRAAVVYPGWFIESTAKAKLSDVWALNPKALPSFILNSKVTLKAEEVQLCAYHLGRYVRSSNK